MVAIWPAGPPKLSAATRAHRDGLAKRNPVRVLAPAVERMATSLAIVPLCSVRSRPIVSPPSRRSSQLFATAVLSNAARIPLASFWASSFAQKWMKNMRGSSSIMWLWIAVTSMPFARSARTSGLTSFPVIRKSPVIAALPPPVG